MTGGPSHRARQAALAAAASAAAVSEGAVDYGQALRRFFDSLAAMGHAPPMPLTLGGLARQQINAVLVAVGLEPLSREEIELARGRHHRD